MMAMPDPRDLTLGDCFAAGYGVTVWCDGRCGGRDLKLETLGRWADHKLLDLMREGKFVCSQCRQPATFVNISTTYRSAPVLRWKLGDDALPGK
jgi:hypothetical protein